MQTTVFVAGGSRSIGKGLVAAYLAVPNTTVIATSRNASAFEALSSLYKSPGSRLIAIELDLTSVESINNAIDMMQTRHSVHALDIVIGNAGILNPLESLTKAKVSEIQQLIDVNAFGQLELYKAVLPLLRASKRGNIPRFCYISSLAGSMGMMQSEFPFAGYGASKALANFLFKWLAKENKDVVTWSQHPGVVKTDMSAENLNQMMRTGVDISSIHFLSIEESALKIKDIIDAATAENTSGRFFSPEGKELPW